MSFGDFLGWCLAFLLPVFAFAGPLRRDQRTAHAYLLTVLLHIAAAAIYVYIPGVLPARGDANAFHNYAVLWQSTSESPPFGISSQLFKLSLAYIYSLIGPSFYFASLLSICAFAFSVALLAKFMELLGVRRGKGLVILLFGGLPTAVLYGSVPLRESYQVLFFMLACYSMLRFRLTNQLLDFIIAIVFALLMGLLHKGLIVYAPFLIVLMLFVRVDRTLSQSHSGRQHVWLHRFAAITLMFGFVVWISGAAQNLEEIGGTEVLRSATTGDGLVELATEHRDEDALSKGRTAYGIALDNSSPVQFLLSSFMILSYYMFSPFPWQVRNVLDVYAFGEVILRIACLVAIVRMWRRGGPIHPQIVTLLMLVYASMAFLWAAGTMNYGTATRHHVVHQWILLLLGVPALLQMRSGFARADPTAADAAAPRFSGSPGTCIQPRIPHLRSLVDTSPPARLEAAGRPPRGVQRQPEVPRLSSGSLARPRRLTER